MVEPKTFVEILAKNGVNFFAGVPDSLLKDVCLYLEKNTETGKHIIAANEGGAVALAAGHYLATGETALVYMQNSGLGNAINPLTSLADNEVYSIPMILLVGWRGEPGVHDEPQHIKMGKVTKAVLEAIDVPYFILPTDPAETESLLAKATELAVERSCPVAIIVQKDTFSKYISTAPVTESSLELSRERALEIVLDKLSPTDVTVSTTGKLSRELFELREKKNQGHAQDFLTVGSMGHASQIALGIALESDKKVVCLDGDGAVIMQMGALAINGVNAPADFLHIVFNNGSHESVGGQPTAGFNIEMTEIALACGYKNAVRATSEDELVSAIEKTNELAGPAFIEIRINKQSRNDLGRPTKTPGENKKDLMDFLNK